MRLEARHEFPAAVEAVEQAMADPAFYAQLRDLPDLAPPEVVDRAAVGSRITLTVRYVFTGHVDPIVRRVVPVDQLVWVQTTEFDTAAHEATLTVVPEKLGSMLQCAGKFVLQPATRTSGDGVARPGTVRTLTGELRVKVPLLGGRAEKALGPGILRRIDLEADALRAWLTRAGTYE
ncbi:MAG: hypothetical protein JWL73_397 [Actinomycetia bacterium]|nr:hypothetical protein [Actinomycetes bacterium]